MADETQQWRKRRAGRRHAVRAAGVVMAAVLAVLLALALLALTETRVSLPDALVSRIETRINARLPDMAVDLGHVSVTLDRQAVPRLALEDVRLSRADGGAIATLGRVGVAFDLDALVRGRVAPRILRIAGARLILRRDADGMFELSFGAGGGITVAGPGELFDAAEAALDRTPFDRVEQVTLEGAEVTLEDARTARVWQVTEGRMALSRAPRGLELTLNAGIFNGTDETGRVELRATSDAEDSGAELKAQLAGVAARDIALQTPALSILGVVDAPVSGALRVVLDGSGDLGGLAGTLRLGAGALSPRSTAPPIRFDGARLYAEYDTDAGRLEIPELSVETALGTAALSGHLYLGDPEAAVLSREIIGQFMIDALEITAPELYPEPVSAPGGSIDLRLDLDPFRLDIGQIALPGPEGDPARTVTGSGRIEASDAGWVVALDLKAARLGLDRVKRFWPRPIAPGVQRFVTERIFAGEAVGPALAVRYRTGMEKPELQMSLGFEGAEVQPVQFLPRVTDGAGFVELNDDRFSVAVDAGVVTPPGRGPVALKGTTFVIPDTRVKPAPAEIEVVSDGPLPSVLALLDRPPLRLLERANRDPDLAEGQLAARTRIALVLQAGNTAEDIDVSSRGTLSALRSERIVPGRVLEAERMEIAADKSLIRADGRATLSGVPFEGSWEQALSGERQGQGRVEGQIALSPAGLSAFGIGLPQGLVSGRGSGRIVLDLGPEAPPAFRLTSDLEGLGLDIAAVNWSKPPTRTGALTLAGTLGPRPEIDTFEITAPGFSGRGRIELGEGPAFRALRLSRVVVGDWLDAGVTISARGSGQPPAIAVTGGSVDLRRAELGGAGGDGGGGRGPVSLRLDRLRLTDTIALAPFAADLAPGGALRGSFRGQVNGGVTAEGELSGGPRGVAVRVTSRDAGAILRDAGLVRRVQGGALDLVLRPTGADGTYDGELRVTDPVLRDAPAIAELLSAISVVGLVEQMRTSGIPFDEVSAEFRVSPRRVTLYRSSAVGASLGLSMDGSYDMVSRTMDMQGVVSPIYLLNRVGSVFTRRGEGLFGVNFTLRGPVSSPQVGVNPLSILTPGAFRDIFRRPPPARAAP